jgi:tRNA nucleotidyltransferase/poly(A) polymerase
MSIWKDVILLQEGQPGKDPTKEQITATLDLLKKTVKNSKLFAGKVYLAGGAVRDMVMGVDPKDVDVVVELEDGGIKFAEFLARNLGIYRPNSNPVIFPKFGTAKVSLDKVVHNGIKLDGVDIEVVNTREEEYDPGSRKPTTKFGSIFSDVARRDLSINALLMDLMSGEILDLTGHGKEDIANGIIRTPSDPDKIFKEDPLRLLRAARFAGRYNYFVPDFMKDSIKKNAKELQLISGERIREELEKILTGKNPEVGMSYLYDLGLMPYVIPQIANDKQGTLLAVNAGKDYLGKLALMFEHLDPITGISKIGSKLKFSNEELGVIRAIVIAIQRIKKESYSDTSILRAGTDLFRSNNKRYIDLLKPLNSRVSELESFFSIGPIIHFSSEELMAKYGLKPGPILGKLLIYQKELWYNNPNITKEEAENKINLKLTSEKY